MGGARERGDGDEKRLQRIREQLADTGRRLRSGTLVLDVPAHMKKGCASRRPAFVMSEEQGGSGSSTFTIITPHAGEACVFVEYLYGLFSDLLDECAEQDFSDRLAEAAEEYCCYVDRGDATAASLLKVLLAEADDIAAEMQTGEFPYSPRGR
jgi:hypothetical protein